MSTYGEIKKVCSTNTRGQASLDRSAMESTGTYNKGDYSSYSRSIHCQNGDSDDCENAKDVQPILGKYHK